MNSVYGHRKLSKPANIHIWGAGSRVCFIHKSILFKKKKIGYENYGQLILCCTT